MKLAMTLAAAALGAAVLAASGPVAGQGQPQTLMRVDVVKVSTGFRASKIIGTTVVNGSNDTIGKIDDVIVSSDGKVPYAILSVGGFLGMGSRLVAMPYDALRFADNKAVLPGATKDALKALPEFKYKD